MPTQTFHITGRVINKKTQHGIPALRVEAWDKDVSANNLLGAALTDPQGGFQLKFTSASFGVLHQDRHPDLFFKVFQGPKLIKNTEQSVLRDLSSGETNLTIEINPVRRRRTKGKKRRITTSLK